MASKSSRPARKPAKPAKSAKPAKAAKKPAPKAAAPRLAVRTVAKREPDNKQVLSLPPKVEAKTEAKPMPQRAPMVLRAVVAEAPAPKPVAGKAAAKSASRDPNIERLSRVRGFVLDLDGTLVLGDARNHGMKALPGALEFVAHLRSRKLPLIALTNGTIRTPFDIARELKAAGFDLTPFEVLTPAAIAASYFTANGIHRVMVLGIEGSAQPLAEAGLALVPPKKGERADAIFIGWFRSVTMDHIEAACGAVERGAKVFSASLAPYFATAEGRTLGTSCAIAGAIGAITGAQAIVLGKPSIEGLTIAADRMNLGMPQLAVIGDDPTLEIPMAHEGGALAIGVTTGTGKADDFARVPESERAHLVVPGIGDVLQRMK